jgi:hypothetical protein
MNLAAITWPGAVVLVALIAAVTYIIRDWF